MTTEATAPDALVSPEKQRTYFAHPKGLFVLFFAEMWERFSFYGMRALLTLYMTTYLIRDPAKAEQVFGFQALRHLLETGFGPLETQPLASHIYGLYTGFIYLSPFFGGIIADRAWGQKKSVYVGGIIMAIGHFLMAFEQCFLIALLLLIIGCGCFKPNISTQVGNLYAPGDGRRDGAFIIFYMGINVGSFLAPIVCGSLGQLLGWHYGFGAAGVGMLLGLVVFHYGKHLIPNAPQRTSAETAIRRVENPGTFALKSLLSLLGIMALFLGVLTLAPIWKIIVILAVAVAISVSFLKLEKEDRKRIAALSLLCLGTAAFWAIYEQQGNTLQLWAHERTDWTFFGHTLPSTLFQSFNPAFIILFAPILGGIWVRRAKQGKATTSVRKMGIGCILCGLAFIVMIIAAKTLGDAERGSLLWLVMTSLFYTFGELYLSPVGLSLVTKVAPARMVSMMMGVWFTATFLGNYLGGFLGTFYEKMSKDTFFLMLCLIGVAVGLLFFAAEKPMKRAIGDV